MIGCLLFNIWRLCRVHSIFERIMFEPLILHWRLRDNARQSIAPSSPAQAGRQDLGNSLEPGSFFMPFVTRRRSCACPKLSCYIRQDCFFIRSEVIDIIVPAGFCNGPRAEALIGFVHAFDNWAEMPGNDSFIEKWPQLCPDKFPEHNTRASGASCSSENLLAFVLSCALKRFREQPGCHNKRIVISHDAPFQTTLSPKTSFPTRFTAWRQGKGL